MTEKITLLKPDSASAENLLPWLKKIDQNGWYTNFGPLNNEFECALSRELLISDGRLMTVANGTSALQLSLEALKLPKNTAVLIPALTFVATAVAVIRAGLSPVIADVDPQTWLLTTETAYEAVAEHEIQAVVPVATFGRPQNVFAWDRFCEETSVPVVIDAAGAFGNQRIGRHSRVIFSLHATKILSAGEGGVIVSPDTEITERIKNRSNFGINNRQSGRVTEPGINAKLSEYHAAVGLANLERLQCHKYRRMELLKAYRSKIIQLGLPVCFQNGQENCLLSIFNILLTEKTDINALQVFLAERGIETRRWYYPLIQNHPQFSDLSCMKSLQNAEDLSSQLLGLPFHLELSEADLDYICDSLKQFLKVAVC